jgi:hypothetical protein
MKHLYRVLEPAGPKGDPEFVRAVHRIAMVLLCGLSLSTVACEPLTDSPAVAGPEGQSALVQLETLPIAEWQSMAGYSRERFPHWSDQAGGCDTRDVVLKRTGQSVAATSDCKITRGTWVSPYDGKTTTNPQALDIDHMVPLANAWRTGAATWNDAKREQFANDLTRPELVAVTSSTNRSKGDQDPSEWRPPNRDYWCDYAKQWIAVKSYWGLSVTISEKAALTDMLGTC